MNKHYTFQEYLENFNSIQDSYEFYFEIQKEIDKLQSNWNSLREWVQKHYDEYKDMEQDAMFEFSLMLDKMNELEGKDKDNGIMDKKSR